MEQRNETQALMPVVAGTSATTLYDEGALRQALDLADRLSHASIVPSDLKGKPADILIVLLTGHELGLQPMQALRLITVVKGKPMLAADLLVARVQVRTDLCEYFELVESTNEKATYRTKRRNRQAPTEMTFTWEDAVRADLVSNPAYKKYPRVMLRHRCAAELAREVYPEVCAGLLVEEERWDLERNAIDVPYTVAPPPPSTPSSSRPAPAEPEPEPASLVEAAEPDPQELYKKWAGRISAIPSTDPDASRQLAALAPQIARLPEDVKDALREVYSRKSTAIKRAQQGDPSEGAIS